MRRRDPKRLRIGAGSALERQALASAAQEEPSDDLRNRMARALGMSAAAIGGTAGASSDATLSASSNAKAIAGSGATTTSLAPWISVGLLGLVVGGVIVASQGWWSATRSAPSSATAPPASVPDRPRSITAAPAPSVGTPRTGLGVPPALSATPSARRAQGMPPGLREQTALIDAARSALATGAVDKALAVVRRYQDKFPAGVFAPEAAALKIEALAKLGRISEARSLAKRFVVEYGEGPLAERVKRLSEMTQP